MKKRVGAKHKRPIESFTIGDKEDLITVNIGDCVLMKPKKGDDPYVAKVTDIEKIRGKVNVHVHWYYRPENTHRGRLPWHGKNELFSTSEASIQSCDSIERTCIVHTIDGYIDLKEAGEDDFYCRAEYVPKNNDLADGTTFPQYCKNCIFPQNPDVPMIQCGKCKSWFHSACAKITTLLELNKAFSCEDCKTKNTMLPRVTVAKST